VKRNILLFVVVLVMLSVVSPVFAEDWTDPSDGGAAGVGAWIAAGFKYFVQHYEGIDLLWWNRRS